MTKAEAKYTPVQVDLVMVDGRPCIVNAPIPVDKAQKSGKADENGEQHGVTRHYQEVKFPKGDGTFMVVRLFVFDQDPAELAARKAAKAAEKAATRAVSNGSGEARHLSQDAIALLGSLGSV